ncbi:MAG: leucine-rich repeat protein [Muribaculaceae bacterium]|nr:leucine-rich repeat protein [Muribaculaceae bacterium]MCM1398995.1 leucine-rich repeat protein [Clostridium sp.]MCM1458853.1 leucine-rich repeat protein [Bacteroides sp.]
MNTGKHTRLVAIVTVLIMVFGIVAFQGDSTAFAASTVTINATNVTLYGLDDWAKEYISIPSNLNTTYQLSVSGATTASYSVIEGNSVVVSKTGKLEPNVTTWYWYGNVGYSSPVSGQEPTSVTNEIQYGKSVISVTAGGKTFTVNVEVKDYADVYADEIMDAYIAENITADMETYEKLEQVAKFVADREYSVYYQSAAGLIVSGGGDCWASTNTIIAMAKKLGLKAWARNGNRDLGAGSGHMNAMVSDGREYFEVEAGYSSAAPRPYNVTKRENLYSTKYNSTYGGIEIYQYDGETVPEVLNIPGEIDGQPVVGIGEKFLSMERGVTKVVLPSTIKYIGNSAFNSCLKLTTINIPASVESLGDFVFTGCSSLKNVSASGVYTYDAGALYKNKEILVYAPCAANITIPEGITEIADYAFYYNANVKSLTVPSSVTKIGEGAFGNCTSLETVTFQGSNLKEIGNFAFAYTDLTYLTIPSSVVTIGENMMVYANDVKLIVTKGSAAETYAKNNNVTCYNPDNVPAETVKLSKNQVTLYVGQTDTLKGTVTPTFASNKLTWKTSNAKVASVANGKITAKAAGTATITVTAAGGETATCKVTVKTGASSIKLKTKSVTLGVKETYKLDTTIKPSNLKIGCTWSSSNTKVAAVSKTGKVTAKKVGTATITVKTANGKKATCKIVVKKAPTTVKLNKKTLKLAKGKSYTLVPKFSKYAAANAVNVKWTTSNSKVVSIKKLSGGKCKITAKKKGTATITYKTYNNKKAKCKVTVK